MPETFYQGRILANRNVRLAGHDQTTQAGDEIARFRCASASYAKTIASIIQQNCSALTVQFSPETQDSLAADDAAAKAAKAEAAKADTEQARLLRKGSLADLAKVNGIGPKTAERLVDHYRVESRHALLAVLGDLASCQSLAADRELRVSQRDLGLWRRQIQAEQVIEDDDDEDDGADTSEE